ncbi:MAG TPA: SCO family protein [Streptosporangiaceae bacterium]|jgi:cytochrome oxidase Cu insertion factor (SCO1/SenC/PrrC family)|nr:SCO family protein [Streptosporangiaceae bacterium]
MPGMSTNLGNGNAVLIAAFRDALLHQGFLIVLVFAVLGLALVSIREVRRPLPPRVTGGTGTAGAGQPGPAQAAAAAPRPRAGLGLRLRIAARKLSGTPGEPEPRWRAVLRIGFGLLWIIDGLLQAQPAMVGLPTQVITPESAESPAWVRSIVDWGTASWTFHPVQAAAAAVWIQLGIGVWMLAVRRGRWSQAAGLAGAAWGLVVWVFGEAFGNVFAPAQSFLTGAPGAALLYVVAGALIALPARAWASARLGRWLLAGSGVFLVGMAVLQAWPGRGFWSGDGPLTGMIGEMSETSQPRPLASLVESFGRVVAAHGFAVNLVAVIVLAAAGLGLLSARPRLVRPAMLAAVALCAVDWVLVQDTGVLGGLGTDPNSMIPVALLIIAACLAWTANSAGAPVPASTPASTGTIFPNYGSVPAGAAAAGEPGRGAEQGKPRRRTWRRRLALALLAVDGRSVAAAGALGITLLGAFPLAAAAADRSADPLIARALNGPVTQENFPAKPFELATADGRTVSLASLRGKTVLLTFLDPVCTTDCPLIAQQFRTADELLGSRSKQVELVAIAANPAYYSPGALRAFDRQEGMDQVPNWTFLTGSLPQLRKAWHDYFFSASLVPAGGMVLHSDVAYVIDPQGRVRYELNLDPGPANSATQSSFASELAAAAEAAMKS